MNWFLFYVVPSCVLASIVVLLLGLWVGARRRGSL